MKTARLLLVLPLILAAAGCARSPGEVTSKVLQDFGLQERPEGYESGADKVFQKLDSVAETEMKRMNAANRLGEIKYEQDGVRGMYYKEVKVYEKAYPLDAKAVPRSARNEHGYYGYISYEYRLLQSPRTNSRTEAETMQADIPTSNTGRESYRYSFSPGGNWDGAKGESSRE